MSYKCKRGTTGIRLFTILDYTLRYFISIGAVLWIVKFLIPEPIISFDADPDPDPTWKSGQVNTVIEQFSV